MEETFRQSVKLPVTLCQEEGLSWQKEKHTWRGADQKQGACVERLQSFLGFVSVNLVFSLPLVGEQIKRYSPGNRNNLKQIS